jgi:ABC-type multidrug transport system fused ATPase/permease subunit
MLMLISGTFVKSPPQNNIKMVGSAVKNIIENRRLDDKQITLLRIKKPASYLVFNIFYTLFSAAILTGVIWLLLFLKFNFVSIGLFFFFVSVVSFFSFRIRNIALELAMKRSKDDALTSVLELFFLPFIRIGRAISDRFTAFNPTILILDLLIEAPLKTIIKVVNSWLRFINAKKEELEF